MYVRHVWHHNGGVIFRGAGTGNRGKHYEIQLTTWRARTIRPGRCTE